MTGYLRRVIARTSGAPLGGLRASTPFRWPAAIADPFAGAEAAAADAAADATAAPSDATGEPGAGASPGPGPGAHRVGSEQEANGVDASTALAAARVRPRREVQRSAQAPEPADPWREDQQTTTRIASGREPRPRAASLDPAAPAAQAAAILGLPEGSTRPSGSGHPSPGDATDGQAGSRAEVRRIEAPRVAPVTPERPSGPGSDRAAGTAPEPTRIVVAAPPGHVGPPEPVRPEIVIGRVSVVVEAARPPVPAARPATRRAPSPPASSARSDGPGLAGRFGLGQM